jgi:D-hexose-6-phosphate mutarotase
MLKELTTTDEIKQYFTDLVNNEQVLTNKIKLAQIYGAAKRQFDLLEKEKVIKDDIDRKYYQVIEINVINDDFQIAEIVNKSNNEKWFTMYYQYKSLHEFADTYDKALIGLITQKYQNDTRATEYISNMLKMR